MIPGVPARVAGPVAVAPAPLGNGMASAGGTVALPVRLSMVSGPHSARVSQPSEPGGSMRVAAASSVARSSNGTSAPPSEAPLMDPETIKTQKETFALELEEQLRRGVESLGEAHKRQTELLHASANQEKHRYNIVLDQQVKQQELLLSQQYNEQLMRLQQAAQAQRAGLEKQACALILEYQQRKVQEEFQAQQAGIQKQHQEAQQRLQDEMKKLVGKNEGSVSTTAPMAPMPPALASVKVPPMPAVAAYRSPAMGAGMDSAPIGAVLPYVPPYMAATPSSAHAGSRAPSVSGARPAPIANGAPAVASFPRYAYQQPVPSRSMSREPAPRVSIRGYSMGVPSRPA